MEFILRVVWTSYLTSCGSSELNMFKDPAPNFALMHAVTKNSKLLFYNFQNLITFRVHHNIFIPSCINFCSTFFRVFFADRHTRTRTNWKPYPLRWVSLFAGNNLAIGALQSDNRLTPIREMICLAQRLSSIICCQAACSSHWNRMSSSRLQ